VWAECVYVLETAGHARARIQTRARGVYFSLARLKENYWADFIVIWQECLMVNVFHLIIFWVTLTYF
jgi:hypothetical protein